MKITSTRSLWRNSASVLPVFALCLILAQTSAADNLLTNPGFESGTDGWFVLGDCNFTTSTTIYRRGAASGYASNRTATWMGIAQSLLGKMQAGQTYTINAWIRLENAPSIGDTISATIKKTDDSGEHYTHVSTSTGYNDQWSPLSGQYTLTVSGTLTELFLYFEGPAADVNYYLDDVEVSLDESLTPEPNATGQVNFGNVLQQLEGFGASSAYYDISLTEHPLKNEIYDVIFRQLGIDILRVRNTYGYEGFDGNYMTRAKEIVEAAKTRNPSLKILLSAWSPAAYLKSSGTVNGGTLKKDNYGEYMYEEYADWWADSLTAWDNNGVQPDYISIQNEPDYEDLSYDCCRLNPTEDSNYAGYDQALEAVYWELYSRMGPNMPEMLAPETAGFVSAPSYINALYDINHVYGFAHHLYSDGDYDFPDGFIAGMQNFTRHYGYKPLLHTEYSKLSGNMIDFTAAMNTARHIHNSLVYEGVCTYLYWCLFWGNYGGVQGLVTLDDPWNNPHPTYTINPVYYAFKHYSYFTDPNWYRVEATTDSNGLRIVAFKNPEDTNLTVVILNVSPTVDVNLKLSLNDFNATGSAVYQTASDTNFAYVGTFNPSQSLLLPKTSITTISTCGTGWSWKPLGSSPDGVVWALTVYKGELIAGGWFTKAGGVDSNNISRWNGSSWQPLSSGTDGWIGALTVYSGELIAGGGFTYAGGVEVNHIARWDGSNWQPLGSGINGPVSALTVYNGKLIAGGCFTNAGGVDANNIAQWDGNNWQPLGSLTDKYYSQVFALSVYNGELIAGGYFNKAGGVDANSLARWDGNNWQPFGSLMEIYHPDVFALAVYNDELIVGGYFTKAGGVDANNIARWNGNNWQPLGSGLNDETVDLTVYNGELIAVGSFTNAGGVVANNIARWNKSSWQPLGGGMSPIEEGGCSISDLTAYEGELIAGGSFTTAGGVPANNIARWGLPVNYAGDLNHDGVVDWFDLQLFAERWLDDNCMYNGWCYEADLNYDFNVNFDDFAKHAANWLSN